MSLQDQSKVINLKLNLLKEGFNKQLDKSMGELFQMAVHMDKIQNKSKGIFSSWQKGIIVWNQALELVRKLAYAFQALKVPIMESGLFEQFNTTLKNLIGSTELAKTRFKELIDFAAVTPFNVPGIIEAGNRLEALGRYSLETVRNLGDLAAASGKPVMQAVEAYTNLVTGRTGIAVKQFRAMLIATSDWTRKIGKDVLKVGSGAKATIEEMVSALPEIIKEKNFTGLMDQQSKTFLGKISNMEDMFQQTMAGIGDEFLERAKEIITTITSILENFRDNAPKYISYLKEIWVWISQIGKLFLGWKVISITVSSVLTSISSMLLPTKVLTKAIKEKAAALKVYNTRAMLLEKYEGNLTKTGQQLGKQWGKMSNTAGGLRLAIMKLSLAMKANPMLLIASGIAALLVGMKAYQKANEVNYKAESNIADTRRRALQDTYDIRKAKLDEAKANLELNKSAEDILKTHGKLNPEIDKQKNIITKLRNAYPGLIDENNNFNISVDDTSKNIRKAGTDILDYEKDLEKLRLKIIETNKLVLGLKSKAIVQEFADEGTDQWLEDWSNNAQKVVPIIGGVIGMLNTGLNHLTGIARDALINVTENWAKGLLNSKTQKDLQENFQKAREAILGDNQFSDEFKVSAVLWLEKVMKSVSAEIKFSLDQSFIPLDKQLTSALTAQSANKTAKEYLDYLKGLQEKILSDGNYKNLKIGEDFFSTVVADGGTIDEEATKGKKSAMARIITNAVNNQQQLVDDGLKTLEQTKSDAEKERTKNLKKHQEALELLEANFQLEDVKNYEQYRIKIQELEKKYDLDHVKQYKDSNSKELQFKKSYSDKVKEIEEKRYKEIQEKIDKITSRNEALAKFGIKGSRSGAVSEIGNLMNFMSIGYDPSSASPEQNEFMAKLKDSLQALREDLQEEDLLKIYLEVSDKDKNGVPLKDAIPDLAGLNVEGIGEVSDMLFELNDQKRAIAESGIYQKNLSEEERTKELYDLENISLTEQKESLESIRTILEERVLAGITDTEQLVQATALIRSLTVEIEKMKQLMKEAGIEYEESVADNFSKGMKKILQGVRSITSNLKSAADEWYNVVKTSVDKQVNAWLNGQMILIDSEEKRALVFARTTQQEEKIKEDSAKKREEAEKEADELAYKRMQGWFELKKAASIANIITDTASAIMNAWSGNAYNPILATAITTLIGATSLAQIAAVSAQELPEKGFARGGYTGNKGVSEPAGIVHGQEFVVRKGPAQKFRDLLELMNDSGYQNGGMVGVDVNRDFRLKSMLGNFNSKANEQLDKLNKNLEKFFANPVPARAYIEKSDVDKLFRQGWGNIGKSAL